MKNPTLTADISKPMRVRAPEVFAVSMKGIGKGRGTHKGKKTGDLSNAQLTILAERVARQSIPKRRKAGRRVRA